MIGLLNGSSFRRSKFEIQTISMGIPLFKSLWMTNGINLQVTWPSNYKRVQDSIRSLFNPYELLMSKRLEVRLYKENTLQFGALAFDQLIALSLFESKQSAAAARRFLF